MIYEILKTGKMNALTTQAIMDALGFVDSRSVTMAVQAERRAGKLILSTTARGGGYYRPANREEITEFIESMVGRAKNIFVSIRTARRYLKEIDGQMTLDESQLTEPDDSS